MINLIAKCIGCKKTKSVIIYNAKTKQDLLNKKTKCFYCNKQFYLLRERKRKSSGEMGFTPYLENNIVEIKEVRRLG